MNESVKASKDYKSFIESILRKDETVLDSILGFIGEMMGKGKDRQHNGVLVCTNQRVVFYSKGFFSEVNRSIPINKISSIDLDKGLMFRAITIHTSNDEIHVRSTFKIEDLQKFQSTIEEVRDSKQLNQPSDLQNLSLDKEDDPISKIKKLSELKEQGIIKEDEFEQKKKELLEKV
jgi:hypothetical protein